MLYIVATPIGNLNDLSYRQAKTISSSDIILSEDTRSTGLLLERIKQMFGFEINPELKLISYYKEKEFEKLSEILEFLRDGKEISLISQSGMPLISDPGYLLVKKVIEENLPYTIIPGPTAVVSALAYSGFDPKQFLFLGFLPKKQNDIKKLLERSLPLNIPVVFYESPNRINKTLEILNEFYPNAEVCICREMTKKFEEIIRGRAGELMKRTYKGEITVVVNASK